LLSSFHCRFSFIAPFRLIVISWFLSFSPLHFSHLSLLLLSIGHYYFHIRRYFLFSILFFAMITFSSHYYFEFSPLLSHRHISFYWLMPYFHYYCILFSFFFRFLFLFSDFFCRFSVFHFLSSYFIRYADTPGFHWYWYRRHYYAISFSALCSLYFISHFTPISLFSLYTPPSIFQIFSLISFSSLSDFSQQILFISSTLPHFIFHICFRHYFILIIEPFD